MWLEGAEGRIHVRSFTTCSLSVNLAAYTVYVQCTGINQTPEYEFSLINMSNNFLAFLAMLFEI